MCGYVVCLREKHEEIEKAEGKKKCLKKSGLERGDQKSQLKNKGERREKNTGNKKTRETRNHGYFFKNRIECTQCVGM